MFRVLLAALAALWMTVAQAQERPCELVSTDMYLYSLYERAPKVDNTGYFGWKDTVAAQRAKMDDFKYAIGGLVQRFKEQLAHCLWRAEMRGLRPAINSAFRDDNRQRMIVGPFKADVGDSFHGGSRRGGWGKGVAVDIVSEDANSNSLKQRTAANEPLWRWLDENAKECGMGRPYRRNDPSHLVPLWSAEWGGRAVAATKKIVAKVKKYRTKPVRLAKK